MAYYRMNRCGRSFLGCKRASCLVKASCSRPFLFPVALLFRFIGGALIITLFFVVAEIHRFVDLGHFHEFMAQVGNSKKNNGKNRILVYITSHLSEAHYAYLENCWPALLERSPLFKQSDFMMFVTESWGQKTNMTLINFVFGGTSIAVHSAENPGYQEGAVLAITQAVEKNWFDAYDWVIRVNPDVLIRDDSFLLELLMDPRIHGVFVDCLDRECPTGRHCVDRMIHTDFFAIRPSAISPSAVRGARQDHAESMITDAFSSIVKDGADAWVPRSGPHRGYCKTSGESSPVIHTDDFDTMHPACLSWYSKRHLRIQ